MEERSYDRASPAIEDRGDVSIVRCPQCGHEVGRLTDDGPIFHCRRCHLDLPVSIKEMKLRGALAALEIIRSIN